jgi:hypothetical protein
MTTSPGMPKLTDRPRSGVLFRCNRRRARNALKSIGHLHRRGGGALSIVRIRVRLAGRSRAADDTRFSDRGAQGARPGRPEVLYAGDLASIHDFHLTGPGVDKKTSIGGTGTTQWTVKLKQGTHHFVCDPHHTIMHGVIAVT